MVKVWAVEPYYGGSHRYFLDGVARHSSHDFTLLTLPGRHWKWRMYGGAVELAAQAERLLATGAEPDVFFVSEMLDLPVFLATLGRGGRPAGRGPARAGIGSGSGPGAPISGGRGTAVPTVVYFHENQLTYPLPPGVERDLGYGFKNITTALVGDAVLFNSEHHRGEFLAAARELMAGMPDAVPAWAVEEVAGKSAVLPLGCDLRALDEHRGRGLAEAAAGRWGDPTAGPLIVWNQRWEYDKAPGELFAALRTLHERGVAFRLAVAGSGTGAPSEVFARARVDLADHVVQWGRLADYGEYAGLLWAADLVASTAIHEFFGVAVLEAVYCGCRPVLPRRLSYPELIPAEAHGEVLYGEGDLVDALTRALAAPRAWPEDWQRTWAARFDWGSMKSRYDGIISDCAARGAGAPRYAPARRAAQRTTTKESGMDRLTVDLARCMAGGTIARGLTPALMDGLRPRLDSGLAAVHAAAGTGWLEWTELPFKDPEPFVTYAATNHGRYDALVVIGIGGSALGTIALATALLPFYWNELGPSRRRHAPRLYVLDNVDPDETAALLDRLDLERTLVNVISKSGTTGESMAGYLVIKQRLEAVVGARAVKEHLVFTTDATSGTLRQIGNEMGVPMFDLGSGVGGRFSVLSSVGLLPAALTGMDVPGLLAGATDMAEWIKEAKGWDNPACAFAGVQYLNDVEFARRISVMMPYSAHLRDIADWYRQLWAESLGKTVDRQGRTVNVGPTPVKSLGVTDQHSQLQLYAEGPDDKIITFLGVGEFGQTVDIPAPASGPEADALGYLAGHTLADLIGAEQKSTAWALAQNGRPSLTITVPKVDARSVGALIYLLEMATAVSGELYDIDAFNQPGVELSKKATYALMGRKGFEQLAGEIK